MRASSLRKVFFGVLAAVPLGATLGCVWGNCPPENPYTVSVLPDAGGDAAVADAASDDAVVSDASDDAAAVADASDDVVETDAERCYEMCPGPGPDGGYLESCITDHSTDGGLFYKCTYGTRCVGGRRPEGFRAGEQTVCDDEAGRYFATQAELEAASVGAFEELRGELRAHGAPRAMLRSATAAARDEVRHARTVGALARSRGARGSWRPAVARSRPARSLGALAAHNAVEGCVRETYAALLAEYQSRAAGDARVRRAMAVVARDEARHAALAFRVASWAEARMNEAERARVRTAARRAVQALRAELRVEPPAELARAAGLPPARVALAMLDGLERALWLQS